MNSTQCAFLKVMVPSVKLHLACQYKHFSHFTSSAHMQGGLLIICLVKIEHVCFIYLILKINYVLYL